MNTEIASGIVSRTARAPMSSISRITSSPAASLASTSLRSVPYRLPLYSTHSRKSPDATAARKAASSRKWYSRPSASPGRGARVVAETDVTTCSRRWRTRAMTVPFPAPEGPEMTKTAGMGQPPK